jgi:hypothetical protein
MRRNETAPLDLMMVSLAILWLASWSSCVKAPQPTQALRPVRGVPYTESVDVVEEY